MINRIITKVAEIIVDGRFTRPRQLSKAADNRLARRILHLNGWNVDEARKLVHSIRSTRWWLTDSEVFAAALRISRQRRRPAQKIPPFENPPDGGNNRWRGRP